MNACMPLKTIHKKDKHSSKIEKLLDREACAKLRRVKQWHFFSMYIT